MAREEAYEHAAKVEYLAWSRGYNPDCVDRDRCYDQFHDGWTPDESADYHCDKFRRTYIDVECVEPGSEE